MRADVGTTTFGRVAKLLQSTNSIRLSTIYQADGEDDIHVLEGSCNLGSGREIFEGSQLSGSHSGRLKSLLISCAKEQFSVLCNILFKSLCCFCFYPPFCLRFKI